jgi:DNA integrity scanning protein DisA with diadenylate cyclase activity
MMLPNGSVFHKTQGRWHYLNYKATFSLLSDRLEKEIATSILRIALDLSYERRGALLCILKQREAIQKMIPDHEKKNRANLALRKSVKGLNINETNQMQIIAAAATADGALVVDSEGIVLDAACMVGDPSLTDVQAVGQTHLQRMPGARSTAAWNASIYGIAIKVSEDGPITIYENGELIGQLG